MEILICSWADEHSRLMAVREPVFVDEQGFSSDIEIDDDDPVSEHYLMIVDNRPVATARLTPDGHIGRVAVLAEFRGKGLGRLIMENVISNGERKFDKLILSSQLHAVDFYKKLGFKTKGDVYLEAGAEHIEMQR